MDPLTIAIVAGLGALVFWPKKKPKTAGPIVKAMAFYQQHLDDFPKKPTTVAGYEDWSKQFWKVFGLIWTNGIEVAGIKTRDDAARLGCLMAEDAIRKGFDEEPEDIHALCADLANAYVYFKEHTKMDPVPL